MPRYEKESFQVATEHRSWDVQEIKVSVFQTFWTVTRDQETHFMLSTSI